MLQGSLMGPEGREHAGKMLLNQAKSSRVVQSSELGTRWERVRQLIADYPGLAEHVQQQMTSLGDM